MKVTELDEEDTDFIEVDLVLNMYLKNYRVLRR
jgi:hypothetical protein